MHLRDLVTSGFKSVRVNLLRSALTMLGIIIGVGSVVLMSAVGSSMETVILSQISSLGPKSMVIFPGQQEGGPNTISTGHDSLTFEDLRELESLKSIESVSPVIFLRGTTTYGSAQGSPQLYGVRPSFFANQNISIQSGRFFDDDDMNGAKAVAMIAPDVQEKFFGSVDPIGKRIQLGDKHFTIIGVTKALGSQFFQNADNRVYVPFTVARNSTGQKYVNYITMRARNSFDLAFDDVYELLRRRHGIDNPKNDPKKDDFVVRSAAQASQILGSVSLGLTMFITAIAAISLIVGGIGIMNIMLVSVTERTREIGLRKALGAKSKDILLQFLFEAVLLTMIGGCIGIVGGLSLAFVIAAIARSFLSTYAFSFTTQSVIIAFGMAAMTGIVFGLSPAKKASQLSPIEALRYE